MPPKVFATSGLQYLYLIEAQLQKGLLEELNEEGEMTNIPATVIVYFTCNLIMEIFERAGRVHLLQDSVAVLAM